MDLGGKGLLTPCVVVPPFQMCTLYKIVTPLSVWRSNLPEQLSRLYGRLKAPQGEQPWHFRRDLRTAPHIEGWHALLSPPLLLYSQSDQKLSAWRKASSPHCLDVW